MIHRTPLSVRFAELDPYDHVNHAAYIGYFEVGRVEALTSVGLGLYELKAAGWQLVVTRLEARFRKAAVGGDRLDVVSALSEIGRAKSCWTQRIERGDDVLVEATVWAGMVDATGRPTRFPPDVVERLTRLALEP